MRGRRLAASEPVEILCEAASGALIIAYHLSRASMPDGAPLPSTRRGCTFLPSGAPVLAFLTAEGAV